MKTIRFLERRTVDYMDGAGELIYEVDSVHTLRDDKAQRWVTRGAAVFVDDEPAGESVPEPQEPADAAPAPDATTSSRGKKTAQQK
jgi:hypothetical protein